MPNGRCVWVTKMRLRPTAKCCHECHSITWRGCNFVFATRGRGIGLTNKIRAYALQDQGHDTLEANLLLGLPADARTYEMCQAMLAHVGINQVALMTNNPNKVNELNGWASQWLSEFL